MNLRKMVIYLKRYEKRTIYSTTMQKGTIRNSKPKSHLLCLFLICYFSAITLAQASGDPPQTIIKAFTTQFPSIEKAKWKVIDDKETRTKRYIVSFQLNGESIRGFYNEQAELLETEKQCKSSNLPEPVIHYLDRQYERYSIKKCIQIDRNGQLCCFEITIRSSGLVSTLVVTKDGYFTSR